MNSGTMNDDPLLADAVVTAMVEHHGVWRVVLVAVRASLTPGRSQVRRLEELTDHLRDDVGLPSISQERAQAGVRAGPAHLEVGWSVSPLIRLT